MCAMNNARPSYHHVIVILLMLVTFSVGVHFVHDMLPGHSDVIGSGSGVCSGVVHYGVVPGVITGMIFMVLTIKIYPQHKSFLRLLKLPVFDPPPIR